MSNEIQLISDGDGLAVIGNPGAVERFLAAEGLASEGLELPRLSTAARAGSTVAQAGSEIAANSGRWMKLSEKSVHLVEKHGLRESSKTGLSTGVVKGNKGQIKGFVEFTKGPGSALTNPALLASAAGVMAQLAMQQTMSEITDYLAVIDAKVDDVLRAQKDTVLARMIGVGFVVEEAMTLRASRGRVDEVTWSKVQAAPASIAETQAYALRQLDALAEKVERKTSIAELCRIAEEAESKSQEWLAVLARSFQLQDAIAVLELDRVLDASPEELDGHRRGLREAREDRLQFIANTTRRLMAKMNTAAARANARVLLNPMQAPAVVRSTNHVALDVADLHELLGLESGREALEARRWAAAAVAVRDKALESGVLSVGAVRRRGGATFERAKLSSGKLAERITERVPRRADRDSDLGDDD